MQPRENDGLIYLKCPYHEHRRYRRVAQQRTGVRWHCTACGRDHVTGQGRKIPAPTPRVMVWKPNPDDGW